MAKFEYDDPGNYNLTYSDAPNARRTLVVEIVAVCFLVAIVFPSAMWLFSLPDYPGSAARRTGPSWFLFLFPSYFRLALVLLTGLGVTMAFIAYIVRRADSRCDYLFGPTGVAHLGLIVSKSLGWTDIHSLRLIHRRRRLLPFLKPYTEGYQAVFVPLLERGVSVRARSRLAASLALVQINEIAINLGSVGMSAQAFESAMRRIHPGLLIEHEEHIRWR